MQKKRDILFFGGFVLVFLLLLAGLAGAVTEEATKTSIPQNPCTASPCQSVPEYHWNPVSRGVLHI